MGLIWDSRDQCIELITEALSTKYIFHIFSIDATMDKQSFGKMVNDSPNLIANASMRREVIGSKVHLCLYGKKYIPIGTEIR